MFSSLVLLFALSSISVSASWYYYNDTNAASACGADCKSNGPYDCLGTFPNVADCEAVITKGAFSMMIYSSGSGHCWTRSDGIWEPQVWSGVISGCYAPTISGCGPPPPPPPPVTAVVATLLPSSIGVPVHPLAPGVTLDFWLPDDPNYGIKWGNASALILDLTQSSLLTLASALSPGLLRLGGSPEDSLIFDADGTCVPGSGGDGPFPGYFCSQVKPYSYACLTPSRWDALLAFGEATGLRVVLGLNGCYGRPSSSAPMDLSNIEALLRATAASPHVGALWGFELSNEVVGNTVTGAAWAVDAAAIRALAASIFGAAGLPTPPIAGPDQNGEAALIAVIDALPAAKLNLTALTYHQYPECVVAAPAYVLAPGCLLELDSTAAAAAAIGAPAGVAVWAGETADHSGGGILNLTDTFASSFYYAWQLAALPAHGVELAARQCLVGGDYELVRRDVFTPNPDYYIAWLFKNLVSARAPVPRNVSMSLAPSQTGVRVFSFASADATAGTLIAINLQLGGGSVDIALEGGAGTGAESPRVEFHITGDYALEHGPIYCNGILLSQDANGQLPSIASLGVPAAAGSTLTVAAASIAFVTTELSGW